MDNKAQQTRLISLYKKAEKDLSLFLKAYDNAVKWYLKNTANPLSASFLEKIDDEDNVRNIFKAQDEISAIVSKLKSYIASFEEAVLSQLPLDKLSIFKREYNVKPVLRLDKRLIIGQYSEAVDLINHLNKDIAATKQEAERLGNCPVLTNNTVEKIEYLPEQHCLIIDDKKVVIGKRGLRSDFLLRIMFKNKHQNLLKTELPDSLFLDEMAIYSLKEGQDKKAKIKYILDGYKKLNDEVRRNIPNGEDLIIRIENGFALNPKLK